MASTLPGRCGHALAIMLTFAALTAIEDVCWGATPAGGFWASGIV